MYVGDDRKSVGRKVDTKAFHLTAISECAQRYSARSMSKEITDNALDTMTKKMKTNRTSSFILTEYTLDLIMSKRKELNVYSIHTYLTYAQDNISLKHSTTADQVNANGSVVINMNMLQRGSSVSDSGSISTAIMEVLLLSIGTATSTDRVPSSTSSTSVVALLPYIPNFRTIRLTLSAVPPL